MKADPAVQRRLLDLAEVDARAQPARPPPPHAARARRAGRGRGGACRAAKDELVTVETRAGDLDRDIRRLERDVEGVRARAERDQQLLAGAGRRRQAGRPSCSTSWRPWPGGRACWRTSSWRSWSSARPSACDLEHSRGVLTAAEQASATIVERRDAALADIDAAEAGRRRDRDGIVGEAPRRPARRSTTSAARSRAVGAAALLQRRCQACRLELDRTALSRIAGGAVRRDRVLRGVRSDPGANARVRPVMAQ